MKGTTWVAIVLVAATALAGCTGQPPATGDGTPTSVSITRAPDTAPANSQQVVCWRVQGSGSIPHTAVHTDTTSHPGNAAFSDYAGPTYYPNNASSASQVSIPGEFCTSVAVGAQDVYLRGHAMQAAPGVVSAEHHIAVRTSTAVIAAVTVNPHNATAPANGTVLVCWRVTGTGNIPHTAIHTDTTPHPTTTDFQAYEGDTFYPGNTTAGDPAGYDLPADLCTNLTMPPNGTLYFRAHAMTSPPGMMSPERSIAVNGTQAMSGVATTVTFDGTTPPNHPRGTMLTVCWRISGTGTIAQTGVATDSQGHMTDPTADLQDYDGTRYFADNMTSPNSTGYATGRVYCTAVMMPPNLADVLYLRAFAVDSLGTKLSLNERSVAAS